MKVTIPKSVVAVTLAYLKADGDHSREGVVLWLARREASQVDVVAALRPEQEARADVFRIPSASMSKIMTKLRNDGLMIGAQVHTHPYEAFHSAADDAWAIVRHVGALSLVLPHFATRTTLESFFDDAAIYVVDDNGAWARVMDLDDHLEILT
jgi:proteasome lid subunit RPN8/RPN11